MSLEGDVQDSVFYFTRKLNILTLVTGLKYLPAPTDVFCRFYFTNHQFKTSIQFNSENPIWKETFVW